MFAPKTGTLSDGLRTELPSIDPGPLMRRLTAASILSRTGTLDNLGAVFKLDY